MRKRIACRRKTLRSLCLQTDIVNFVNFVNILMMTSLVRAKEEEGRRESKSCFLVWPKCNLHVNQISSFVAWPSPAWPSDDTRLARAALESFKAATSGNLLSATSPTLPSLHCAISPKALNRNYVDDVDEAVGVSALTV